MGRLIPYFKEIIILDQLCLKIGLSSSAEDLSGYKSYWFQWQESDPFRCCLYSANAIETCFA